MEIKELEEICQLRHTHPHCKSPEHTLFTNTWRNKFVWGPSASLKSSMTAVFCRPELIGGNIATQLENTNAMAVIGFRGLRG